MAEAAFLLRMANHWLQFEGDINASLTALQRADEVLLAIQSGGDKDEYDLLPVRTKLAQEVLALESVQRIDVQGIYLRLGALVQTVPNVRSSLTLETTEEAPSGTQASSTLMAIAAELEKFVRITDLSTLAAQAGDAVRSERDHGPAEILAARRTVVAALERAQLAVLRGEDDAYQLSLEQAQIAARRLASASDPQLQGFLGQISALAEEPLTAPLPKITGALDALSQLMESL
jgi:uroporphyrin-3 C-methyltransferase